MNKENASRSRFGFSKPSVPPKSAVLTTSKIPLNTRASTRNKRSLKPPVPSASRLNLSKGKKTSGKKISARAQNTIKKTVKKRKKVTPKAPPTPAKKTKAAKKRVSVASTAEIPEETTGVPLTKVDHEHLLGAIEVNLDPEDSMVHKSLGVHFDALLEEKLDSVLKIKVKAGKYEISKREQQQAKLIRGLRKYLKLHADRLGDYTTGCVEIEYASNLTLGALKETGDQVIQGNEVLTEEIREKQSKFQASLELLLKAKAYIPKAQEECAALDASLEGASEKLRSTVASVDGLKKDLTENSAELASTAAVLHSVASKCLSSETQLTDMTLGHQKEIMELTGDFDRQLAVLYKKTGKATKERKELSDEKDELEKATQQQKVTIATVEQSARLSADRTATAVKRTETLREDTHTYEKRLESCEGELNAALVGFTKSQAVSQCRTAELNTAKSKCQDVLASVQKEADGVSSSNSSLQDELDEASKLAQARKHEFFLKESELARQKTVWAQEEETLRAAQQVLEEEQAKELTDHEARVLVHQASIDASKAAILKSTEAAKKDQDSLDTYRKHMSSMTRNVAIEDLCKISLEAETLRAQCAEKMILQHEFERVQNELQAIKEDCWLGENQRRKMHNEMQDLRGNVRVVARVRPFLSCDGPEEERTEAIKCHSDGRKLELGGINGTEYPFVFNQVFPPGSKQESIFEEVSALVQSALDGYNVCLFSYGQTGSGKTHTMQGSLTGAERGIIPRSVEKVLEEAKKLRASGWQYTLEGTFLEIYNENVRDLLGGKIVTKGGLLIKLDHRVKVHVPGLTRVPITNKSQIADLMKRAAKQRSTACTNMNATSSRSHSVFTLHLTGIHATDDVKLTGQLNLVDLAGSERLSRSGATGARLKEAQSINKSLSCISDVFAALQSKNKKAHIPYRNSKLTYLLQSCFSGQGKTLMFVNLSPSDSSAHESLCSLRFADKVNNTCLGRAEKEMNHAKDRGPPGSTKKKRASTLTKSTKTKKRVKSKNDDAKWG